MFTKEQKNKKKYLLNKKALHKNIVIQFYTYDHPLKGRDIFSVLKAMPHAFFCLAVVIGRLEKKYSQKGEIHNNK